MCEVSSWGIVVFLWLHNLIVIFVFLRVFAFLQAAKKVPAQRILFLQPTDIDNPRVEITDKLVWVHDFQFASVNVDRDWPVEMVFYLPCAVLAV